MPKLNRSEFALFMSSAIIPVDEATKQRQVELAYHQKVQQQRMERNSRFEVIAQAMIQANKHSLV